MIGHLLGTLLEKHADYIIVQAGPIGYEVSLAESHLLSLGDIGQDVELWIHTHVKEDILQLFGFADKWEKELFRLLISCNGVGPKLALTALSGLSPQHIQQAILNDDVVTLSSISGIGKKTAERIVLELKEKVRNRMPVLTSSPDNVVPMKQEIYSGNATLNDALSALINLGYQRNQIEKAIAKLGPDDHSSVEHIVKSSLKLLSKGV